MKSADLALGFSPLMTWKLAEVLEATRGTVAGATAQPLLFESVSTDSRRPAPGALFFALTGPSHDGHDFAAEALSRGATAVVVERIPTDVSRDRAILVADSLRALGDLARWTRRRALAKVIGITGSNGKTTTKELTAAICERAHFSPPRCEVLRTAGTENNLIGVPQTLLRMTGNEAAVVLELGMSVPGEIARLTEIADPDVGLVTNVGPVHLEGCGSLDGVASAKGELFRGMRPDATIAVNMDDHLVVEIASGFRGRRIEFGRGREVEARSVTDFGLDGVAFDLRIGGATTKVRLRLAGLHNVSNALAAAAAAHALGIGPAIIRAGLQAVEPPPKRLQIVHLSNGTTLLNDSYNANPANVRAALEVLTRQPGRSIAVLGEMRELGSESVELHRQVGALAARQGVHVLVAVGSQAGAMANGARQEGMKGAAIHICADAVAAAQVVITLWQSGDVILVKGSRGAATDEAVRAYGSRMAQVVKLLSEAGGPP
jgi:UDP-N-acetylmuramoyl-tripeptide--D-alanyl-D-alanine ligase